MLRILSSVLLFSVAAFCASHCHSEHGLIESDPLFKGFQGQMFRFDGQVGGIYHLFSDPYVSINTKFGVANAAKKQGTVINQVGFKMVNLELLVSLSSFVSNDTCDISVNSKEVRLDASANELSFDDCNVIKYSNYKLVVRTPMHEFTMSIGTEKTKHIDQPYINIEFDQSFESAHLFGGVLGQTASPNAVISRDEADFKTSSLFSTDAKTNKYRSSSIDCTHEKGLTSRQSIRSEGTNLCGDEQYCTSDSDDTESFGCNSKTCFDAGEGCPTDAICDQDSGSATYGSCLLGHNVECKYDISCYEGNCLSGQCGCIANSDCDTGYVCSSTECVVASPSAPPPPSPPMTMPPPGPPMTMPPPGPPMTMPPFTLPPYIPMCTPATFCPPGTYCLQNGPASYTCALNQTPVS